MNLLEAREHWQAYWDKQVEPRHGRDWYVGGYLSALKYHRCAPGGAIEEENKVWWRMGWADAKGDMEIDQ